MKDARTCGPCDGLCLQGRDCPSQPKLAEPDPAWFKWLWIAAVILTVAVSALADWLALPGQQP